MGRKRQRRNKEPPAPAPKVSVETVVEWQGEPWVVRPIRGSSSTRSYRCPGCDQMIQPATPHTVVWPETAITGEGIDLSQGATLLERRDYRQIWIHQYVRVKVLRHLFMAFPDEIGSAKEMDDLKRKVVKPADHRLFVTNDCHDLYGESTSRGVLTRNCRESLLALDMPLPDWAKATTAHDMVMGREPFADRVRRWFSRKLDHGRTGAE